MVERDIGFYEDYRTSLSFDLFAGSKLLIISTAVVDKCLVIQDAERDGVRHEAR